MPSKISSEYAEIVDHLDIAAYLAIHSKIVYSLEDLTAVLQRVWNERASETSQA